MYKSGGGVDIFVSDFRYVEVTDENGNAISDHSAAECDFTFIKTADFIENTQELQVTEPTENNFQNKLRWIFKAFIMILSDLCNLPELIKEFI